MLDAAAAPSSIPVSSNSQVLDDEGQQFLQVQEHAAAVQLLNRSLAVAHLRAELVKPRGTAVLIPHKGPAPHIKPEPGTTTSQGLQHPQVWQHPQLPVQHNTGAPAQRAIAINLSTELGQQAAEDSGTQQRAGAALRALPNVRRHLHRPPDPGAVAKWMQSEGGVSVDDALPSGSARQGHSAGLAPRITADPALQAQHLAGWVRVGADGAGEAGGELEAAAGLEELPGAEEQRPEDEFMDDDDDEEEWI